MFFGALRVMFIFLIVQTVIYVCLSFYSRAVRRDKLEAQWDAGGIDTPRQQFVAEGLEAYDGSIRRKLILGVYVVPILLICLIIYLTNYA
ncbi:MAG: hypothetical protein AAF729_08055 [Pseudomonadota bacterium]